MPEVTRIFGSSPRTPSSKPGPQHAMIDVYGQAWCGVKQQFRHWNRPGTIEQVTCARCLKALKNGRPQAWKSR